MPKITNPGDDLGNRIRLHVYYTFLNDTVFTIGQRHFGHSIYLIFLRPKIMIDTLFGLGPNALFGMLSALLSTCAFLPYIVDTLKRRTQPQRASWLIWSVLGSIAFFSQVFEGATHSLWFAGIQVSGTILVFLLSIPLGMGGFLNRRDQFVLLAAAGGLIAWYLTETAVYALAITISISLLGGAVTVCKAFRQPNSETMTTWAVSFAASICAILAVGRVDWVLLAYPLYLLVLNGAIVLALVTGRASEPQRVSQQTKPLPA